MFEPDDIEVPPNVLASAPSPLHNGVALVRFYEASSKSRWSVPRAHVAHSGYMCSYSPSLIGPGSGWKSYATSAKTQVIV